MAVQIPLYVFVLTKIEYLHLDLRSNERRMVVSQQQDVWRRIPFLGFKKGRLMSQMPHGKAAIISHPALA